MDQFPRLYSLSIQQRTPIAECGIWDGAVWIWNLQWRRQFFQWELQLYFQLQIVLQQINLVQEVNDYTRWKFHRSYGYSVKNFQQQYYLLQLQENQYDVFASKAWRNICPPKAELLLWLVLQGRVNTRNRLRRFNILRSDDSRCVLCEVADESVQHLFFTCQFAWKVWTSCC